MRETNKNANLITPNKHSALLAWNRMNATTSRAKNIHTLKFHNWKSQVYRIEFDNQNGDTVIAKLGVPQKLLREHKIISSYLTQFSLPYIQSLGFIENSPDDSMWLFLEDAGEERYNPACSKHRELLSNWLSELHIKSIQRDNIADLPLRTSEYYLERLDSARVNISNHADKIARSSGARDLLTLVIKHLTVIEKNWKIMESIFLSCPLSLVHGDLVKKNLRIKQFKSKNELMVFDWDVSGWGFLAADLFGLKDNELLSYFGRMKAHWNDVTLSEVKMLGLYGRILRLLQSVFWESFCLSERSHEKEFQLMSLYSEQLTEQFGLAGFQ